MASPTPEKAYSGAYNARIQGKVWTFCRWSYETKTNLYDMVLIWDVSNPDNPTDPTFMYAKNMEPLSLTPHRYAKFLKEHFKGEIDAEKKSRTHHFDSTLGV